jgi:uncharacterized protein YkwD
LGKRSKRAAGPKLVGENAFASIEHRVTGRRVRIGSASGNDLILPHRSVSAHHAVIRQTLGAYYIRDLGSTNGTFLNGKRIAAEQPLHPGDELRFGAARFAMVAGSQPVSSSLKYFGAVVGLVLLAGAGYLAVNFVRNWENLEKLAALPPKTTAPIAASQTPAAASTAAAETRANPAPSIAEVTPPPTTPEPAWLNAINEYRAGVHLAAVTEDPKLSDADRKHAMYVVKNYAEKAATGHLIGALMHDEEKGNPWYTTEGHAAAAQSDIDQQWGHDRTPSPTWALDRWISGPFHRFWILNPALHHVGYGEFCEKKYCVAALDLGDGADPPHGVAPLASPIEFPADKSITAINSFSGEWPTPLTACAGYSFPAGLPATIQLGTMVPAKLSEYQITRDGHGVESCGIDASSYQNPVSAEQERGRGILSEVGAAMIIPRYPLRPGRYSVTATLNDHAYQWSFTVAGTKGESASSEEAPAPVATTTAGPESAASKPPRKDEFETALRGAYARLSKSDTETREEYERDIKGKEAAAAASNAAGAAALAAASAKVREFQRRSESAFPEGLGAVAVAGTPQWLAELNRDRAAIELPPVAEDAALSDGDLKHAKYVAMNCPNREAIGDAMHNEDPAKPGYTAEGLEAARHSEVVPYWYPPSSQPPAETSALAFLNVWLAAPFHRASILYPDLHKVGFGEFCHDHACAAALDASESAKPVAEPIPFAHPILFPPPKFPIALVDLQRESPDPTSACPGYALPVGLPITVQVGANSDAKLSSYALTQDSKPVPACGFDWSTYSNPDAAQQKRARDWLHFYGEVVILPRQPLQRGASYQVSATVNDHPYQWSFTVAK